jgi:Flp pilus assembly pilin Flp
MAIIVNFLSRERPSMAIEYGMTAAGILATMIAVAVTIGTSPNLMVMTIASALK